MYLAGNINTNNNLTNAPNFYMPDNAYRNNTFLTDVYFQKCHNTFKAEHNYLAALWTLLISGANKRKFNFY